MSLPPDVWVAEVSSTFPAATFRLLTGVPVEDRSLELGEVLADDPGAAVEAMRDHPDVVDCEVLYADDQRAMVRYEAIEQRLYEFLGDASLPPEFPVVVADGTMEFDVTATGEQFEAFGTVLDESPFRYDLLTVVHGDDEESLLTARQRECLTVALREGYFAVPREATLAEVADRLGVDTSTASETIRRANARLVEWFLVGQG